MLHRWRHPLHPDGNRLAADVYGLDSAALLVVEIRELTALGRGRLTRLRRSVARASAF